MIFMCDTCMKVWYMYERKFPLCHGLKHAYGVCANVFVVDLVSVRRPLTYKVYFKSGRLLFLYKPVVDVVVT